MQPLMPAARVIRRPHQCDPTLWVQVNVLTAWAVQAQLKQRGTWNRHHSFFLPNYLFLKSSWLLWMKVPTDGSIYLHLEQPVVWNKFGPHVYHLTKFWRHNQKTNTYYFGSRYCYQLCYTCIHQDSSVKLIGCSTSLQRSVKALPGFCTTCCVAAQFRSGFNSNIKKINDIYTSLSQSLSLLKTAQL